MRVEDVVARIDDRERGRDREVHREREDEQRAEHELGHREPDQRDDGYQRVHEFPSEERGQRREDQRDREVEGEREDAEKERVLRALADRRRHRLVVHERTAEVALDDVAEPDAVPLPDRLIEVELVAEDLALLRGRLSPEHALGDVAGQDAGEEEDDRRDDDERGDGEPETLNDESENQTMSRRVSGDAERHPGHPAKGGPGGWFDRSSERYATCTGAS